MRQQLTLLVCILLMSIPSALATEDGLPRTILAHKSVSEDGKTQPLIEWFCDSDSRVCRDFEEDNSVLMDRDEDLVWLSWHPAYNEEDPLGNGDSNIRSDELMTTTPAVRLDFQRLEGIGDGTDFNAKRAGLALNGSILSAGGIVAAEIPLEITLIDLNGDDMVDEIDLTSEFTPRVNLSSDVILNFVIVEWYPEIRNEGPRPPHTVKEWTATAAFSKEAGNTTSIQHTFSAEHISGAEIEIDADDAQRFGIIAFLSGHTAPEGAVAGSTPAPGTPAVVLGLTEADLPTMWEGTSSSEAISRLGFLFFALLCIGIIIMTERQREYALPRISGRLLSGEEDKFNAVLEVKIGKHDATLEKVEVLPPWKMKKKPALNHLKAGTEKRIEIGMKCEAEYYLRPAIIRFSMEVETFGGWVMDLRLTSPITDTDDLEEE